MRAYIKQIRLETGLRVCAKVYEEHGDKPSKVRKLWYYYLLEKYDLLYFLSGGFASLKKDLWISL